MRTRSLHCGLIAAAGLSCLAGCAGLSVEAIGNTGQAADAKATGVRFYQEAPFLFVYADGKGGVGTDIKWLPDTTQLMSASPYAVLSKNETTMEFLSSALTTSTVVVDDTIVVNASLEALGKVLAAAAANTASESELPPVPAPKLYRIIVNGDANPLRLSASRTVDIRGNDLVINIGASAIDKEPTVAPRGE
jgi:hypothetical protein